MPELIQLRPTKQLRVATMVSQAVLVGLLALATTVAVSFRLNYDSTVLYEHNFVDPKFYHS